MKKSLFLISLLVLTVSFKLKSQCDQIAISNSNIYINFSDPPCNCGVPITQNFEVWGNEGYFFSQLISGTAYQFEFCNGYNTSNWGSPAEITILEYDWVNNAPISGTVIAFTQGCNIIFTPPKTGAYVAIISVAGDCGGNYYQTDNGEPTFQCLTGGTTQCTPICPDDDFVNIDSENFNSCTQPMDWTTNSPFVTFNTTSVIGSNNSPPNGSTGCIIEIDDDAAGTGEVLYKCATSPAYDISTYIEISIGYNWENVQYLGEGITTVEIGDGNNWTPIFNFSNDGSGMNNYVITLNQIQNILPTIDFTNFQVRFCYDDADGSNWLYGAGFDNFHLCGKPEICPLVIDDTDDTSDDIPDFSDNNTYLIEADDYIVADNRIAGTSTVVVYDAQNYIRLVPDGAGLGFRVFGSFGAEFTAKIGDGCGPLAKSKPSITYDEKGISKINTLYHSKVDKIKPNDPDNTKRDTNSHIECHPNPSSSHTIIEYYLEENGFAKIELLSFDGRLIKVLEENSYKKGFQQKKINLENLLKGIYLIKVTTKNCSKVEKLVVN